MSVVVLAALAGLYVFWPAPPLLREPLPSPNGYDDFVRAGKLLGSTTLDYSKLSRDELKACISTNHEALRLVRLGLTRECRKPLEYSKEYLQQHWGERSDIARLAQLISAEGRLAELEARYGDAARIHLDNLRLGELSARGGMILEKIVGVAIERIGMFGIERVADHLSNTEAKESLSRLKALDERSQSTAEFIERDRLFTRRAYRLVDRVRLMIEYRTPFLSEGTEANLTEKIHQTDLLRRQLIVHLAARIYELEHGKPATRAEDLAPSILQAIPTDPKTGTNLILNPTPTR